MPLTVTGLTVAEFTQEARNSFTSIRVLVELTGWTVDTTQWITSSLCHYKKLWLAVPDPCVHSGNMAGFAYAIALHEMGHSQDTDRRDPADVPQDEQQTEMFRMELTAWYWAIERAEVWDNGCQTALEIGLSSYLPFAGDDDRELALSMITQQASLIDRQPLDSTVYTQLLRNCRTEDARQTAIVQLMANDTPVYVRLERLQDAE